MIDKVGGIILIAKRGIVFLVSVVLLLGTVSFPYTETMMDITADTSIIQDSQSVTNDIMHCFYENKGQIYGRISDTGITSE